MNAGEVLEALAPVANALEKLGVSYHLTGSFASSAHGIARSTVDVDLVADLRIRHVEEFVSLLGESYYSDAERIREAVLSRTSFNLIHLSTMVKLDVFVLKDDPFHQQSFRRAQPQPLRSEEGTRRFPIASPEDVVLHKLAWYKAGGGVSDRQWKDVVGVVKVQGDQLDRRYMARWAAELSLSDLLDSAMREAGGESEKS